MLRKKRSTGSLRHAGAAALLLLLLALVVGLQPAEPTAAAFPGANGKIAFTTYRSGNGDIYVMDADGGNLTQLTFGPDLEQGVAWSADGMKIAYSHPYGPIFVMNADGSDPVMVPNTEGGEWATWSPDGMRLAFMRYGEICVINLDGSDAQCLTSHPEQEMYPAWSPDGTKIAYHRKVDWYHDEIYVMNADGTDQTQLTSGVGANYYANWSPDGTKIAFSSSRDGNGEIYVMNADGSGQTRLTFNGYPEQYPVWSPDGTKIIWHCYPGGDGEICLMNADGSGLAILINSPGQDFAPDWGPAPNLPPVAAADSAETTTADFLTIAVLANDSDPEGEVLALTGVTEGTHGTVVANPDDTVTYTRDAGFNGIDAFTYTVRDPAGRTAVGDVAVRITPDVVYPADPLWGQFTYTITAESTELVKDYVAFDYTVSRQYNEYMPGPPVPRTDTTTVDLVGKELGYKGTLAPPAGFTVTGWSYTVLESVCNGRDTGTFLDPKANILYIYANSGMCKDGSPGTYRAVYSLDSVGSSAVFVQTLYEETAEGSGSVWLGEIVKVTTSCLKPPPIYVPKPNWAQWDFSAAATDPRVDVALYPDKCMAVFTTTYDGWVEQTWNAEESGSATAGRPEQLLYRTGLLGPSGPTTWSVVDDNDQVDVWMVGPELWAVVANLPPVATDDYGETATADFVTVAVLSNDSDPDSDVLSVSAVTSGANGTTAINPDNTVTYTRNAGFNGSDTFSYTVSDGKGGTAIGTVSVQITPDLNLPPDVDLGQDVVIAPDASIGTGVTIGDEAVVESGAVVQSDAEIGAGTTVEEGALIGSGATVGDDSTIGAGTEVKAGSDIGDEATIGDGVVINQNVSTGDGLTMGDGAMLMQDVVLGDDVALGIEVKLGKGVVIGDDVAIGDYTQIKDYTTVGYGTQIGANCLIKRYVQIGHDVVIGAGRTVNDYEVIPDGTVMP